MTCNDPRCDCNRYQAHCEDHDVWFYPDEGEECIDCILESE